MSPTGFQKGKLGIVLRGGRTYKRPKESVDTSAKKSGRYHQTKELEYEIGESCDGGVKRKIF